MVSAIKALTRESTTAEVDQLVTSIHDVILSVLHMLPQTAEAEGISKGQFLTMHVLSAVEGASVSDVARHLAVKAPSVCVTVDQLEAAGLVTRRRSSQDHRTVEVFLTPKGRRVESRVWARIGGRIAEAARDIQSEDVAVTVRVFSELNRQLEARDTRGEKA